MSFDFGRYLTTRRQQVDQALRDLLPQPVGEKDYLNLYRAMGGAVLDGGKRLRPCLTIAACEALGGAQEAALPSACAIEMIHAYSLVHDDLPAMDDDDLRRGKPTCHKQYGEAAAILTGCALLTRAFEILAEEGLKRPDQAVLFLKAASEMAQASGAAGMVGGQAMDMTLKDTTPPFGDLEACHARKTAALFAGSAALGALAAGGTDAQVTNLRDYGFNLGMAFQHADDLRDADFPEYRQQSLDRCTEYTDLAAKGAQGLGEPGRPLIELTKLVEQRAREAN